MCLVCCAAYFIVHWIADRLINIIVIIIIGVVFMFIHVMFTVLRYLRLYVVLFLLLAASLLNQHINIQKIELIFVIIIIIIIIIQYVCLPSQAFLPGTSLEPAVIPTAQASSFTLQYFPYYV